MSNRLRKHEGLLARFLAVAFFAVALLCLFEPPRAFADNESLLDSLDGYGTRDYPYLIYNASDLDVLRSELAEGNALDGMLFALMVDIDFEGEAIEPLSDGANGVTFKGGFDGRGHTLKNFSITAEESPASFFGGIDGAVINLTLEGTIEGDIAASFATYGSGGIMNCASTCDLVAHQRGSGIAESWVGEMRNVVFSGTILAPEAFEITDAASTSIQYAFTDIDRGSYTAVMSLEGPSNAIDASQTVSLLNESSQAYFLESDFGKQFNSWIICDGCVVLSQQRYAFAGSGSPRNPYVIDSPEKLVLVNQLLAKGYSFGGDCLIQTNDINLVSYAWLTQIDDAAPFCGTYNGDGHVVSGLYANGAPVALFAKLDGMVLNLGLSDYEAYSGFGFARELGPSAFVVNSFCLGNRNFSDFRDYDSAFINCFIQGVREQPVDELNRGLEDLVIYFGIHCGDLRKWTNQGQIAFSENFRDEYLHDERARWSGSGVERDPYRVRNIEDLIYLRESVYYTESFWGTWFQQENDIDLSRVNRWAAISGEYAENAFSGIYDGNGHRLIGFAAKGYSEYEDGTFFGNVRNGTIMNVHMLGCHVAGNGNGLLAFNVLGKGKIINNVIEVQDVAVAQVASLVFENSGKVLNNLIVSRDQTAPLVASKLIPDQTKIGSTFRAMLEQNQIVSAVVQDVVDRFNENLATTAELVKQRVTNLNQLQFDGQTISFREKASRTSAASIGYIFRVLSNNPMLAIAIIWLIGCLIYGLVLLIKQLLEKRAPKRSTLIQLNIVIGIHLAFVIVECARKPTLDLGVGFVALIFLMAAVFIFGCIYLFATRIKDLQTIRTPSKDMIPIALALAATCIMAIGHFGMPVAYDADLYYGNLVQSLENFDFTVSSVMEGFVITNKPMHGIVVLMALGEFLSPGNALGIYVVNTVLLVLAQAAMYSVIKKLFPHFSNSLVAVLSLCFAFSGYIVAGATYINADFYAAVMLPIFIYCLINKKDVLCLYSAFLMLSAKYNMAFSYIAFLVVLVAYWAKTNELRLRCIVAFSVPLVMVLVLYWVFCGVNSPWGLTDRHLEFGAVVESRMLQYFAFGFVWLPELLAVVAVVYLIRKRGIHAFSGNRQVLILAIWVSCIAQLGALLFYGEGLALCPRYLSICAVKNTIIFAFALDVLPWLKSCKTVAASAFCLILTVQLFASVDPTVLLASRQNEDRLHYLVSQSARGETGNDLAFYNYEYANDAQLAGGILSQLNKSEICLLGSDRSAMYKMALGSSDLFATYWDASRNVRTYIKNDNCVRLDVLPVTEGLYAKMMSDLDRITVILRDSDITYVRDLMRGREAIHEDYLTAYRSD